jgi:hypothetical protein
MNPVIADLAKLRNLLDHGWQLSSVNMHSTSQSSWRTTIILKLDKQDLTLQSDDHDVFEFCIKQRVSFDESGEPAFRGIADLSRYHHEAFLFAHDYERLEKKAIQRLKAGQIRLEFSPDALIADFLKSRKWGDARFLPLKAQYFDILMMLVASGKRAADSGQRLQKQYPESVRYANRIDNLLRRAFDPFNDPIKNYLRFADIKRNEFAALSKKLIDQMAFNNDTFARLAKSGGIDGHIGLGYVIDMYRRYIDWATPLLKLVSDAVCIADGKAVPEVSMGITKRVEIIRQSSYSDIVDCVDPRIRHAASHGGISYDKDQGIVKFSGIDSDGNRKFDDFELSYAQTAKITRDFIRGFVPGIFSAFGMHQLLQLLMMTRSGDYLRLLLLIDNEAPA